MLNSNNNIIFFEVFEEEKNAISKFLPNDINATFHQNTIQETCKFKDIKLEKNTIISIRTQSIIPEKDEKLNIDGEMKQQTPISIEVLPKQINDLM